MTTSKFVKVDPNILIEYIYNDSNLIGDPYEILYDNRTQTYSYMLSNKSSLSNNVSNQLFCIDPTQNTYAQIDVNNYIYLQLKDYPSSFPITFDTVKLHFPINYTFGNYYGFKIKVYGFDVDNQYIFDISDYYFDISDYTQTKYLNYSSPVLEFNEMLWGKEISIQIPSINSISNQVVNGKVKPNTINYNLTNGIGLNQNTPIFIDFQFITNKQVINNSLIFTLNNPFSISVPQSPQYDKTGLVIRESSLGDFFEIFGVYNNDINEFNNWINDSIYKGKRYYVQYIITLFESNIRGQSLTILQTNNFNEPIIYRPVSYTHLTLPTNREV